MFTLQRIATPLINAFFITVCLFYVMYSLVRIDEPNLMPQMTRHPIIWVSPPDEEDARLKIKKPVVPKEVEEAPVFELDKQAAQIDPIKGPSLVGQLSFKKRGELIQPFDKQLILALGYPPEYPARAISRNIQGYAVVGFSVSASGTVFDPFIIESEPNSVFDRSALKAISKFKYKPRTVNGNAVSSDGQRYMFTYKLDD